MWDGIICVNEMELKTCEILIKFGELRLGKTIATIGSFCSTLCISTTTKQRKTIGWEPVASTNCTERYLVGVEFDDQLDGEED